MTGSVHDAFDGRALLVIVRAIALLVVDDAFQFVAVGFRRLLRQALLVAVSVKEGGVLAS